VGCFVDELGRRSSALRFASRLNACGAVSRRECERAKKTNRRDEPGGSLVSVTGSNLEQLAARLGAGAAADRRVVEADVAAATAFAALLEAFAALLDHLAAGLVAAGADDAAAVLGEFALAVAASEIALAAGDAVIGAAAAAESVAEHLAEVLQGAAGDFVFTAAPDLAAGRGLFELDAAARQNAPVGGGRRALRNRARLIARTRERRTSGRTAL
jgi:hypothetical protein